ncbi:MAK10-like protein [Tanacetum coccineum]
MGDANPIRTLGDYSKASHEGYMNTIELPVGNNVVPLRSDAIWLVQNGCSFYGLWSEDPNRHLKDFLKLVDSLDLDGENRERTRMLLFQFSLRDQARNWLERLPAGSITTCEDLTTCFLAQFFPPRRTAKFCNDILMFQQHHGDPLSEAWTPGGKLRDRNAKESWALLEDLALYDNESWNDLRDFAKPVKAISLPQDVPSTSDRCLIELENQVQCLMEAHLALTQPTQVNKITTSCEIYSGPHNTQYCMEDPKRAFFDYASSRTDGRGSRHYQTKLEKALIDFDAYQEKRLSSLRTQLEQQQDDMIRNPATQMNFTSTNDTTREELRGKGIKSPSKLLSLKYLSQSSLAEQNKNPSSPKCVHFVNSIVILNKEDETKEEGSLKTITTECEDHEMTAKVITGNLNNVKFSCMIGHFDKKQAYLDMESPINVMSRLHYNWIMSKRLGPRRKPLNPRKICNFVGRVKGLKVFVGNFTRECDFMVLEDTTSVIDHDLGLVISGKPFVEATSLIYDREEGTITFEKDEEKIMFRIPYKMEMFKHIDFTDMNTNRILLLS